MKILVVGDLHGNKPIIHFKDFDAIISIGDVCSDKEFRPLVKKWFQFMENNEDISLEEFMLKELGQRKLRQLEIKSLEEGRKNRQEEEGGVL